MARRRSGFAKTIDFKSWLPILGISLNLSSSTKFLGANLSFEGPGTILRLRGEIVVDMVSDAATEAALVGLAIGIASADAVGNGVVASLPGPLSDVDYPWLWWSSIPLWSEAVDSASSPAGQLSSNTRVMVDSKAMRKVKPNESLFVMTELSQLAGTPTARVTIGTTRVLLGV